MSRQEKIREGLTLLMSECYSKEGSACRLHPVFQPQKFLNKMFPYLHSEGARIVGELPSIFNGKGEVMSAMAYKKKLVFESLMEEIE